MSREANPCATSALSARWASSSLARITTRWPLGLKFQGRDEPSLMSIGNVFSLSATGGLLPDRAINAHTLSNSSCERHRRAGRADHQHVVPDCLVVDVDSEDGLGSELCGMLLQFHECIAHTGCEFVLVRLRAATEDVAHTGGHILEDVDTEHPLSSHDSQVFRDASALDAGRGRNDHRFLLPWWTVSRSVHPLLLGSSRSRSAMISAISPTKLAGASKGAAWAAPSIRCALPVGMAAASDRVRRTMKSGLREP